MVYTVLPVVAPGETIASATWGNIVKADIEALKAPPNDQWDGEVTDTTTATDWSDVDATNLSLTITTTGGNVRVCYIGDATLNKILGIDLDVDGTRHTANTYGLMYNISSATGSKNQSFTILISGLSAAAHTVKLQFRGDGTNANQLVSRHFSISEVG